MATNVTGIKLYKRGSIIVIWYGLLNYKYIYWSKRDACKKFKERFGLRGKVETVNRSPYLN